MPMLCEIMLICSRNLAENNFYAAHNISALNRYLPNTRHRVRQPARRAGHSKFVPVTIGCEGPKKTLFKFEQKHSKHYEVQP